MRDGTVLAQETPAGLLERTGARDTEEAFLSLIHGDERRMSRTRLAATTRRVLTQLRRDPRTVGLMLVVPLVLLWLLDLVFQDQPRRSTGSALPCSPSSRSS